MAKRPSIDAGFLSRTYKTTLLIGGLVTLLLCSTANAKWVVNYVIGVLTMLAFVKTTELFVTQTYRAPNEVGVKSRWVAATMLGKWLILAVGLYLLNKVRYFDGVFMLMGLVTFHAVIIFKVLGLMLQNQFEDKRGKTANSQQVPKGGSS